MEELHSQILQTWQTHQKVMILFLEELSEGSLSLTLSKRGGRNIARQIAHLQNVRVPRLKSFARKNNLKLTEFDPKETPTKNQLLEAFKESGEVMENYIKTCLGNGGKVPNFKRGVLPMIGYYISHESQHRGNILLTLKQCGHKIPEKLRFGLWEWNKI